VNSRKHTPLWSVYRESVLATLRLVISQPILLPLFILAFFLEGYLRSLTVVLSLGITGGFIVAFIRLAFVTYLFQWLIMAREDQLPRGMGWFSWKGMSRAEDPWKHVRRSARRERILDLIRLNSELFFSLLTVAFPLYLVQLAVSLTQIPELQLLYIVFTYLALNPLSETAIMTNFQGADIFRNTLIFMKRYFVAWLLPLLLPLSPYLIKIAAAPQAAITLQPLRSELLFLIATSDPIYPTETLFLLTKASLTTDPLLTTLLGTLLALLLTAFRLELYSRLTVSLQTP
jgi:hypothetical protein